MENNSPPKYEWVQESSGLTNLETHRLYEFIRIDLDERSELRNLIRLAGLESRLRKEPIQIIK